MTWTAWALLLLAPFSSVASADLPRGEVSRRVVCLNDAEQSYALYLPTGYRPERPSPILYCFDPGGDGNIPVALFRAGAEKFNWIVVSSHNSRNGPWGVILRAARALWYDTHARFAVDDGRVYGAGFSGGARAACGLGKMLAIPLTGVIGCGAGLPEWLEPNDMAQVPWFGTVGLRDFNYREMQELEGQLRRQGSPCLLRIFHGGHSWPPVKLALEAIAWLEERYTDSVQDTR
jgi:hypothetical protein